MTDPDWMTNQQLEEDLKKHVSRNLKRSEILDFVKCDYPQYPWSIATLDRRLRHFNIYYINYDTSIETIRGAVQHELQGPGQLLGYRALNLKLRTLHAIQVPRNLVYNVMKDEDPEGLEGRRIDKRRKPRRKHFVCDGSLNVVSLDGHDKLCGYQNWTFPLGVYGCIDTFSRKMLFLFVCHSNSNPSIIGKRYLEFLYENKRLPRYLRIDKGTETGTMATMHSYLCSKVGDFNDPVDSIMYGPSTTNKIERWWRDLHERLEKYFKEQLVSLLKSNLYDPHNLHHRKLLGFIYIPIIQKECDIFVENWNSHRIREQKGLELPTGVPDHMFSFPEKYGGNNDGFTVTTDDLKEVARLSGVLEEQNEFINEELRHACETVIPNLPELKPCEAMNAYIRLKNNVHL